MALAPQTSWNAEESATLAAHEVLFPLQDRWPGRVFVLGGLAALLDSKPLADWLVDAPVPTSEAPIIIHVSYDLNQQAATGLQQSLSGHSPHLSGPFHASIFPCELDGVHYRGHLKLVSSAAVVPHPVDALPEHLQVASPLLGRAVLNPVLVSSVNSEDRQDRHRNVHFLNWAAVVVEQLGLGARADEEGRYAAMRIMRCAWLVGRGEVAADLRGHVDVEAAVQASVQHALGAMLNSREGLVTMDGWITLLGEVELSVNAADWEYHHRQPIPAHLAWPDLHSQYSELIQCLHTKLKWMRTNHPHGALSASRAFWTSTGAAGPQHSLAKSPFQPERRENGQTRAVFS